jgi:hypothetical protein
MKHLSWDCEKKDKNHSAVEPAKPRSWIIIVHFIVKKYCTLLNQ